MSDRSEVVGPLAGFASGFAIELEVLGYRPRSAAAHLELMAEVSGWLFVEGLGAGDLTDALGWRLMAELHRLGRSKLYSVRALAPLLGYLRDLGVAPAVVAVMPLTAAGELVARYSAYLFERRGLSSSTVRNYVGVARAFFSWREAAADGLALDVLDAAAVIAFVLEESQRGSVGSAKCLVTRLRALLRFLYVEGEIDRELAGVVPSIASWRNASLVKALDVGALARLLGGCDRRTPSGRRSFAVITMLSRLGLRAAEVASLQLSDIDWHAGEILIRGKGSRLERLPLPVDVGEALAGWVQRGRPRRGSAFVFTSLRAPYGRLSAGAVTGIVRNGCRRAGLPVVGAHRLRHTAATEMLRAGGSLAEVGQVLRHRSRDVTSIYAKVNRVALSQVVAPWPGSVA